jgi:hypothetical protein
MTLTKYKSTSTYGRSKLRFNFLHESDPMRLSIHERSREKRFSECAKELLLMTLDNRLDRLVAEFVLDFDALTKAGSDTYSIYSLTKNQQAAINYALKHAAVEIKHVDNCMIGINILDDLQLRAQKLLVDPVRLIRLQCSNKWWHG